MAAGALVGASASAAFQGLVVGDAPGPGGLPVYFALLGGALGVAASLVVSRRGTRRRAQYLEWVLGKMSGGAIAVDEEYRVARSNRAFQEQRGMESDPSGAPCYSASFGLDEACYDQGLACPVQEVFDSGEEAKALRMREVDDEKVLYELSAYPMRDGSGEVVGATEVSVEVGRREPGRSLGDTMGSLEALSGVARKRPGSVNVISGWSDMLEEDYDIAGLAESVNDLMEAMTGREEEELRPVDLAGALEEAIRETEKSVPGVSFELDRPDSSLLVEADAVLPTLLGSLLDSAAETGGDGSSVRVSVADDGERAVVKLSHAGSGNLVDGEEGFDLVERLVGRYGGEVWVEGSGELSVLKVELNRVTGLDSD